MCEDVLEARRGADAAIRLHMGAEIGNRKARGKDQHKSRKIRGAKYKKTCIQNYAPPSCEDLFFPNDALARKGLSNRRVHGGEGWEGAALAREASTGGRKSDLARAGPGTRRPAA